jgi:hypothetical protein
VALWVVLYPRGDYGCTHYDGAEGTLMEWTRILAYITGTVDQELLLLNEYLAAENRILMAKLNGRPFAARQSKTGPQRQLAIHLMVEQAHRRGRPSSPQPPEAVAK